MARTRRDSKIETASLENRAEELPRARRQQPRTYVVASSIRPRLVIQAATEDTD